MTVRGAGHLHADLRDEVHLGLHHDGRRAHQPACLFHVGVGSDPHLTFSVVPTLDGFDEGRTPRFLQSRIQVSSVAHVEDIGDGDLVVDQPGTLPGAVLDHLEHVRRGPHRSVLGGGAKRGQADVLEVDGNGRAPERQSLRGDHVVELGRDELVAHGRRRTIRVRVEHANRVAQRLGGHAGHPSQLTPSEDPEHGLRDST